MTNEFNTYSAACWPQVSGATSAGCIDFHQQCVRILRCTAKAMATSPGGLKFKAGTRPWLDGLTASRVRPAAPSGPGAGRTALAALD